MSKKRITVVCPMLNEARFVPAWLMNVSRYADEIIVMDMGSTDGTPDMLVGQPGLRLLRWPEVYPAYRWPEGRVRNALLEAATGEWILKQDADELWPPVFFDELPGLLNKRTLFVRFPIITLWRTFDQHRVSQFDGPGGIWDFRRWWPFGGKPRLWRNTPQIRYRVMGDHAFEEYRGLGKHSPYISCYSSAIPFFHYHFVLGLKQEGERRAYEALLRHDVKCQPCPMPHPGEAAYLGCSGPFWPQ